MLKHARRLGKSQFRFEAELTVNSVEVDPGLEPHEDHMLVMVSRGSKSAATEVTRRTGRVTEWPRTRDDSAAGRLDLSVNLYRAKHGGRYQPKVYRITVASLPSKRLLATFELDLGVYAVLDGQKSNLVLHGTRRPGSGPPPALDVTLLMNRIETFSDDGSSHAGFLGDDSRVTPRPRELDLSLSSFEELDETEQEMSDIDSSPSVIEPQSNFAALFADAVSVPEESLLPSDSLTPHLQSGYRPWGRSIGMVTGGGGTIQRTPLRGRASR